MLSAADLNNIAEIPVCLEYTSGEAEKKARKYLNSRSGFRFFSYKVKMWIADTLCLLADLRKMV